MILIHMHISIKSYLNQIQFQHLRLRTGSNPPQSTLKMTLLPMSLGLNLKLLTFVFSKTFWEWRVFLKEYFCLGDLCCCEKLLWVILLNHMVNLGNLFVGNNPQRNWACSQEMSLNDLQNKQYFQLGKNSIA